MARRFREKVCARSRGRSLVRKSRRAGLLMDKRYGAAGQRGLGMRGHFVSARASIVLGQYGVAGIAHAAQVLRLKAHDWHDGDWQDVVNLTRQAPTEHAKRIVA
ncbi:MAG: hypothetical protein K8T91_04480 [Planctomycetes bacterium]|nr:hypothetical protein [Planctomycetota bacterium]